jgi:hypothetical protein
MYLATILAQHLDLPVQAVSRVYLIFMFDKFIYNWDVMLYSLVHGFEHFKQTCHLHFQGRRCPECGSSRFLWNNGIYLPNYKASHPRGQIFKAKDVANLTFMFECSVEMQGLEVLPKPQVSTKGIGKIYKCTRL